MITNVTTKVSVATQKPAAMTRPDSGGRSDRSHLQVLKLEMGPGDFQRQRFDIAHNLGQHVQQKGAVGLTFGRGVCLFASIICVNVSANHHNALGISDRLLSWPKSMSVLDLAIMDLESPIPERVESGEWVGTFAQSPSYPFNPTS
jgi:hypothetical protein